MYLEALTVYLQVQLMKLFIPPSITVGSAWTMVHFGKKDGIFPKFFFGLSIAAFLMSLRDIYWLWL